MNYYQIVLSDGINFYLLLKALSVTEDINRYFVVLMDYYVDSGRLGSQVRTYRYSSWKEITKEEYLKGRGEEENG